MENWSEDGNRMTSYKAVQCVKERLDRFGIRGRTKDDDLMLVFLALSEFFEDEHTHAKRLDVPSEERGHLRVMSSFFKEEVMHFLTAYRGDD